MLDEMIDEVGYENIIDYLENDTPLGEETVYIRFSLFSNVIETFIFNEENKDNEIALWFRKRQFYADYLGSNKAIVQGKFRTSKIVTSAIKESLIFNWKTFMLKVKKELKNESTESTESIKCLFLTVINEYYENLKKYDIERVEEIEKISSKLIDLSDKILEELLKIEKIENKKIKIFLDTDLEEYKRSNKLYLEEKIFDTKTEIKVDGKILGRYSGFITLNNKKPYLKMNGEEIFLCTKEEAIKYRNLLFYISRNRKPISTEFGEIKFKFNPKDGELESFENIPFKIEKKEKKIPYRNVLNLSWYKEDNEINISNKINYLIDGFLYKESKQGKYNCFQYLYKDSIESFTYKNDETKFRNNLNKISRELIEINKNIESNYRILEIMTFILNIKDYFGMIKYEEIDLMNKKAFEKLKNYKNLNIESDEEFLFFSGQLAHYLATKSKANFISNTLLQKYCSVKKITRIKELIKMDMQKYSYNEILESRINIVFAKILEYVPQNEKIANNDSLLIGLFGENIFYKKIEKVEGVNDEKK